MNFKAYTSPLSLLIYKRLSCNLDMLEIEQVWVMQSVSNPVATVYDSNLKAHFFTYSNGQFLSRPTNGIEYVLNIC